MLEVVLMSIAVALPSATSASPLPYIPPPPDSPHIIHFLRDTTRPKLAWSSHGGWYEAGGLNESILSKQVEVMATKLRSHGWTVIFQDYGFHVCGTTFHPSPLSSPTVPACIHVDKYGRPVPSPDRYPSAYTDGNNGSWKNFASMVHAKGLAFGLHLTHGIPKVAVQEKLPIFGTSFTADEVVRAPRCSTFIADNWNINTSHPGAQAYYDSVVSKWAGEGVDFIYLDGVMGEPSGCDIGSAELMADSLRRLGNGMYLITSWGPPAEAGECSFDAWSKLAPYVRVGPDTSDTWEGSVTGGTIYNSFSEYTRLIAPKIGPHHFGDLAGTMIGKVHCHEGSSGCAPGPDYYIPSNQSSLTKDEVISHISMTAIFRSSWWAMGVLSEMDDFMFKTLTNDALIRITMMAHSPRQVMDVNSPSFHGPGIVWTSDDDVEAWKYVLLMNLCTCPDASPCMGLCPASGQFEVEADFKQLGLSPTATCDVTELWENEALGKITGTLKAALRPHASLLVKLSNCRETKSSEVLLV